MNPTPTMLIIIGVLASLFFCTTTYFWSKSEDLKADLAFERFEHSNTKDDLRETERRSSRVLQIVAPLVEKTDWMTGRWGGKFNLLVQMEKERNETVEVVRHELMSLPFVNRLGVDALKEVPEGFTPELI